jgi:MarR family transcriptional regulator, organic hydroperoxide resistance regulator
MAAKEINGVGGAEPDAVTSRSFVEAFDGMVRQVIVPNSHKAAQDLQMGPQDVRAMIWLGHSGRCLMTDFARGVGVPLSTATHLANRLVEKGVMFRERSEQDRRVVSVGLSDLGRKLDSSFFLLRLARSKTLLSKLNLAEQKQLVTLMQKVVDQPRERVPTRKKEKRNES